MSCLIETPLSTRKWTLLEWQIQSFCTRTKSIRCKWLWKRPVSLEKYLECTRNRADKTRRMQLFDCACELIKTVSPDDMTDHRKEAHGEWCFEFRW